MKTLLVVIAMFCTAAAHGQSDTLTIDRRLQDCLDSSANHTTIGMSECIQKATVLWDAELNRHYQELLQVLSGDQKKQLRAAQRQWIRYRDQELEFSNNLYYDMGGSMWIPVAAERRLQLTKQRALELAGYLENLRMGR